ncbi:MAG: CotH kinase family protein [Clostridia bacterium]|nr:CotH kinase family protein [Clostridia bacterium]
MKKLRFLCAVLAALLLLPAASVALAQAPPSRGAAEYPITPIAGDGVELSYDESAFSLVLAPMYGMLRIEQNKTISLTASFGEGWTYNEQYTNFFRDHSERVSVSNGANGEKVFTFTAVRGEFLSADELACVGVYASPEQLPQLCIDADLPFSQIDKEAWVTASFTLTLGTKQFASGDFEGTGSIKGRGNTSWGQPKKPYSIKLDSKKSLLDIPKTKKYAIVASYSDPSFIRNYMTYKAGLMLSGIGYVPKCEFVEVYLNGSYNGIYLLVERVDIESNKIDIEEASADELTGGYLIEKDVQDKIDFSSDLWFNCPYWANQGKDYFVLKTPEPDDAALADQMRQYLEAYMQRVHNAIMGTSGASYTQYVDVDSWIDFMIVQELAKNVDGNMKTSCYMFKQAQDDKLYFTAPWDFDLAYGNPETTWNNADYQHNDYYDCPNAQSPSDFMVINSSAPWFDKLYDDREEFRTALMERYAQYRRSLVPAMFSIMDAQGAYLSAAAPRDEALWHRYFHSGLASLRGWFNSRVAWLDGEWLETEPIDLDFALNAEGGSLHFETSAHPFTGTVIDGRIAAVSGCAGMDSAESSVTLTLDMLEGETLSFDYRCSTEQNYDLFTFIVNGQNKLSRSGESSWQSYTFTADHSGRFTFLWRYSKDYSYASGSDCVWLDEIAYSGDTGAGLLGDADDNGTVNVSDALLAMRFSMGIVGEDDLNLNNADIDASGSVTMGDAVGILRIALGID